MGVMEDSMTLYRREMLIFKSHLRTNIIRSAMFPIIFIFFFGAIGSTSFGINVAVVNYANNQQSTAFINSLTTSRVAAITAITTQTDALAMLSSGTVSAVIVILPTFPKTSSGNPAVDVYYSNSNFEATQSIIPFIEQQASSFNTAVQASAVAAAGNTSARLLYGTTSNYTVFLVAGIICMTVAFGMTFGTGMSLITDRQLGNLKSFMISPISKDSIVLSKIMAGATEALLYIAITLIIGAIDGVGIAMGFVGLLWIIAIGIMVAIGFAGISTILASRIEKVEVYTIVAQVIVMPLWFLSGAFFPATSFPSFMQPIVTVDPLTYATQGIRNVMMLGYYPVGQIALDMAVLLGFMAFGIIGSILLFKNYTD